ncbi:MAG: Transcriptional regulator [uncultured Sulfurovum sp.]|uniref:Transcriptional regulator n=1 Tax=uncultured Sulfurovum sp. TaxID=269237 RepID=A0A6S6SGC7_9BACT|nr:MAG: Transcriptional regulator [uncultured Sulfurovum sp.]
MNNLDENLTKFYKTIGSNVKKIREDRGLTQLELSQQMNFNSVGLIGQAEIYYNKQHFSLKHLFMIASILECSIEDFFEGIKVPPMNWDIN